MMTLFSLFLLSVNRQVKQTMKPRSKIVILALTMLVTMTSVNAQTPQEQLRQLVGELQKTPTDNALREKIIKLAVTLKPAPTVSDEALKFEGRAQFAFKNAKAESDFVAAALEYEKAVAAAPWVAGYYSDLCTIYEKAGKYADAKQNCGYYLVSLVDADQISEVKRRIAGFDYGIEQAESAQKAKAAADTPEARETALLKQVEGAKFIRKNDLGGIGSYDEVLEIKGGMLYITIKIYANYSSGGTFFGKSRPGVYKFDPIPYTQGSYKHTSDQRRIFTISKDGQSLMEEFPDTPVLGAFTIDREK